jgi:hypothetical protein
MRPGFARRLRLDAQLRVRCGRRMQLEHQRHGWLVLQEARL